MAAPVPELNGHGGEPHGVLVPHRLAAFAALVVLATASLLIGTRTHWPWWDVAISLAIAAVKTGLVLWFFMDLSEQPFRARLAVLVAVLLIMLLVGLTAADVGTRQTAARATQAPSTEAFYRR
jgi:cytochrome c oxidase subunit 4